MSNEQKIPKVVLIDHEEKMSLTAAADFLESIAKKLREEGKFTLTHGVETHEVAPSSTVELEIKLEKEWDKNSFEIEIEWKDGNEGNNSGISIS